MLLKIQASIKNCINTLPRVAPNALRIPISRVRSVTDTSIMFITPIPPTSKEIAAIPPNTLFNIPVKLSISFKNSCGSGTSNLPECSGFLLHLMILQLLLEQFPYLDQEQFSQLQSRSCFPE